MQQMETTQSDAWSRFAGALVRDLGMTREDAREITGFVRAAFGGEDELHDDDLSPDLRSVFYTIEQQRLLSFRREEYRNEEGHVRRAFYWRIRWDEEREGEQTPTVYDELPRNAWARLTSAS